MEKVIFFGNGPLAEHTLSVLNQFCEVIFHAQAPADLAQACQLKKSYPKAHGILASFGVIIKPEVLDLFEPTGILNLHPSLLPLYRGPSPIESAILNGDTNFGISVIKLSPQTDAGPIYWQTTLSNLPLDKSAIYQALAETGAKWLCQHLDSLPTPVPQDNTQATYTAKLTKSMGILHPGTENANTIFRQIIAFQGFPKPKYSFYGTNCIILAAHLLKPGEQAALELPCADGQIISIDKLQPEGKRPMDAKAFLNGYKH